MSNFGGGGGVKTKYTRLYTIKRQGNTVLGKYSECQLEFEWLCRVMYLLNAGRGWNEDANLKDIERKEEMDEYIKNCLIANQLVDGFDQSVSHVIFVFLEGYQYQSFAFLLKLRKVMK